MCVAGGCQTCQGTAGTFHNQRLDVDGEDRYYYLHVPSDYSCDSPWPVLVDFHGTSGGSLPEESYALAELVAIADASGFIVVRPRSRSKDEGGGDVFRWDENPGDLELNATFTRALVADLATRYRLDPTRTHTAGFSSGTNMAAQFLADSPPTFVGFGFVGGGMWDDPGLSAFAADAPRIYTVSGYRDYMFSYLRQLDSALDLAGYPAGRHFNRETDAGHELYGWHYQELWPWLDAGVRPAAGTLAAPWVADTFPASESLLGAALNPDGDVVATGTGGAFFVRDHATGAWSAAGSVSSTFVPHFAGLCLLASGVGIAVGEQVVAHTSDGGHSWTAAPPIPEFQGSYFGSSYLNAAACTGGGDILGGGYWTGVESLDAGSSWQGASMDNGGYGAQIAQLAFGPSGTAVAVGYLSYVGRRASGGSFTVASTQGSAQWYNGVAAGPAGSWWVVGEAGEILGSSDDGLSFTLQPTPKSEDLYAVAFADGATGLAVGAHGTALATHDGGQSWQDVSTGLDGYLGAAIFLDASHALALGEHGTAVVIGL